MLRVKNCFHKSLALALALMLLVGAVIPVYAAEENLIANPGFEEDPVEWVYFDDSAAEIAAEGGHDSSRALVFGSAKGGVKHAPAVEVKDGTVYKVAAWVYGQAYLKVAVATPAGVEYVDIADGGKDGEWTYLEGSVDLAQGSGDAQLIMIFQSDAEKILIDDVMICETGASTSSAKDDGVNIADLPKGDNLFPEPGFEQVTEDWLLLTETPPTYSTEVFHDGAQSMQIPTGNGIKLLNRIDVETGVTYELTAWVYGKVSLIGMMYDHANNPIDYYNAASPFMGGGEEGKWTQISGIFMTDDERVGNISIEFRAAGNTEPYVDDISFRSCGVIEDTWEPTPSPDPVRLGCYYFNNWVSPEVWSSIKDFPEVDIEPVLGYYRDASPEVQEWHIKQATQHGISFWVFDWYFDLASNTVLGNNAALTDGFLKAENCEDMDFALLWCNEEKDISGYTEENLLKMTELICENYLSRSNYLKTDDGQNILVMTQPNRFIEVFGLQGAKSILRKMDEAAAEYGGFYYVGVKYPTEADMTQLKAIGIEATTLYSYNNEGIPQGAQEAPYEKIIQAVEPIIRAGDKADILPIIPCVSPGWDSRPWADKPGRGTWRSGSTPELFGEMCTTLRQYADPELNMMIVGTWNEFGEGSHIEPTTLNGCSYLDALQKALFPENFVEHDLLAPSDAEKEGMVYDDIPPAIVVNEDESNYIINPSFERGYGWETFGSGVIQYSNDCKDGEQSMILTTDLKGVKTSKQFVAEPNVTYTVSAWVKGDADMVCALFDTDGIWITDAYYEFDENAQSRGNDDWVHLTGTFTNTDPNVGYFDVEIINASEDGSDVLVDMVELRDPSSANNDSAETGANEEQPANDTEGDSSNAAVIGIVVGAVVLVAAVVVMIVLLRKNRSTQKKDG